MDKKFRIFPLENKTVSWWNSRRSKIDMDPLYQRRGGLWSDTDKGYLIDSILNGYDIPKLYVADFTWGDSPLNKKRLSYAIIDGKQRLEAIFDFYDGKIVLNDDLVYLEDPQLKLGGLGYKDLVKNYKEIADQFDTYNLSVMSVVANDEKPINDLFVRLNRSKALTGAEVRNAMAGPAPVLIREIAKHEFFTTNIRFEVKRGQDKNAAAKILLFECNNGFKDTTKEVLDTFVEDTAKADSGDRLSLSGRQALDNLGDMSKIFLPYDKLLNSAGIIPVYYWFVRNVNTGHYHLIRKFLIQFERERKNNRMFIKEKKDKELINTTLVEYDNYNRSTNNQKSHERRYAILNKSFSSWLKTGKI
jgi:hypothetical protein